MMASVEQYYKQACSLCEDGFPIIIHDGNVYFHDVMVARTSPDADPCAYCEASPIRAAVAEAVAEERESIAKSAEAAADAWRPYLREFATFIRARARAAASAEEEA